MNLIEKFKSDPKNIYYLIAAIVFILINVIGLVLYQSNNKEPKTINAEVIIEPSITPTESPEPTDFPTPTADPTPTVKPTSKPTVTITPSPSNTPTPGPTSTPVPTDAPSPTPTGTI